MPPLAQSLQKIKNKLFATKIDSTRQSEEKKSNLVLNMTSNYRMDFSIVHILQL
jgi:hypothetical protein